MTIAYWDAFSGIAGDMTVAALIDAGAPFDTLVKGLDSLQTGAAFQCEKTTRGGLAASIFKVEFQQQHKHRHLPQILRMIEAAAIPDTPKQNAARVFQRLAEAEAQAHNVPIEKVHFHEVGAVDSICDIVGACYALHLLNVDEVLCSAINVGSGTVQTEHGVLPVPAPATAALLTGKPIYSNGPAMELTTPTGAALAVTLAASFGPLPPMTIRASGYGAGTKDFPGQANVLRVLIGERASVAEAATVVIIEANIDDCTPQVLGYAMDRLFAAGALDVTIQPLLMKKNRQGSLLRIIATPETQESLAAIVFAETPTLGLRIYKAERRVQPREFIDVQTPHGTVKMKVSANGSFAPEYDDCRRLAETHGVPLRDVIAEANFAYLKSIRMNQTPTS
ncbi:MAG: nickel pincer cofactor biosynthesis protein LarC [Candidatus Solibacter usitatus]|nr:nickel pincer cofactor biosynthesis protein LarC [Candidatus Solibacter usitatus]